MVVKTLAVGPLEANCYIIADENNNKAVVIDPGDEPDRILDELDGLEVQYIILTHAHFDHAGAVGDIKEATGAELALHFEDSPILQAAHEHAAFWGFKVEPVPKPDILLNEGDELIVGDLRFHVIHTPGHSPGSICLYVNKVLITGDTLFAGSVGRTDLPGGNMNALKASYKRLMALPDDTAVLSGHGPASTIGRERADNFFSYEV